MKQQLMMLLLGTASVLCSCETQIERITCSGIPAGDDRSLYQCMVHYGQSV